MADRGTPSGRRLVLGDRNGIGQVHVDLEAFFQLSFWLSEEVEGLVRHWHRRMPRRLAKRPSITTSQRSQLKLP